RPARVARHGLWHHEPREHQLRWLRGLGLRCAARPPRPPEHHLRRLRRGGIAVRFHRAAYPSTECGGAKPKGQYSREAPLNNSHTDQRANIRNQATSVLEAWPLALPWVFEFCHLTF